MKTYLNLLFTTLLIGGYSICSFAFNNIDALLDNSDITWAAEVYTDYAPTINYRTIGRKEMQAKYGISTNTAISLKIQQQPTKQSIHLNELRLAELLLRIPSNTAIKFFKDPALKESLNYADYHKITQEENPDTVFVSQADGTQKIGGIFNRQLYPNDVKLFRVKQILSYNIKTNQLDLIPIAIAPLAAKYNKEQQLVSTTPLFWVPIQEVMQAIDLNQSSINWAKRMTRSIDTDEVTVIKGKESFAEILNKSLNHYAKNPNSSKLYNTYGDMSPMSTKQVKNINSGIDTIITFDPQTFEETVSVVTNKATPETMHKIRIIQDWVWNKETKSISIQFVAFAPILKRYDSKQNFLNSGPLFYKKPKE